MTLALLACGSCGVLPGDRFAVRCTGVETTRNDAAGEDAPGNSIREMRTYVIDAEEKAIYRADPAVISNFCGPDGQCGVEVTDDRVKGLFSDSRLSSPGQNVGTETQFSLNRDTGNLKLTRQYKFYSHGQVDSSATSKGDFSCVKARLV
jgi:hypothetical protein